MNDYNLETLLLQKEVTMLESEIGQLLEEKYNMQLNEARQQLQNAISNEVKNLIENNDEIKELIESIKEFENDCYMKGTERRFDECGELVSCLNIHNNLNELDSDIKDELFEELRKDSCVYIKENDKHTITLETFLGDATIINFSNRRKSYAIFSDELKLKIDYSDLIGDDDSEKLIHALYLIECAMRKAGVYGNIVEVDYYGNITNMPSTELGNLSDEELAEYGKQFNREE